MNTIPRKKGYVPNKYTGRSLMYHGGKKKDFKAEIKEEKENQEKSVKEI